MKEDPIGDLIDEKAGKLEEETFIAVQAGEPVPKDQLEDLERLIRLSEIRGNLAKMKPPRQPWPMVAVLMGTLLVVSILLFWRIPETEIELDVLVTEVEFSSARSQMLTEVMSLASLGVVGAEEIEIPRSRSRSAHTLRAFDDSGPLLRISVATGEVPQGQLTLSEIRLPSETRVRIGLSQFPGQYRMSFNEVPIELTASVSGSVNVASLTDPPELLDFGSPKSMAILVSAKGIDLDMELAATARHKHSPQVLVNKLAFSRVDQHIGETTLIWQASTLLQGKLYLEELNGKTMDLRAGEQLRFNYSNGVIRSLEIHNDRIALRFHGNVSGMKTGSEGRSLMPSVLEWLQAHHSLSLLWVTTIYLVGMLVSFLQWLRISV